MRNSFTGLGATLALGLLLALGGLSAFAGMLYLRLQELDPKGFADCLRLGEHARDCAAWRLYQHLADPHWLALQFSLYATLALVITLVFARPRPREAAGRGLLGGLVACITILTFADPGRLPALATLFGSLTGGLIAARRGKYGQAA